MIKALSTRMLMVGFFVAFGASAQQLGLGTMNTGMMANQMMGLGGGVGMNSMGFGGMPGMGMNSMGLGMGGMSGMGMGSLTGAPGFGLNTSAMNYGLMNGMNNMGMNASVMGLGMASAGLGLASAGMNSMGMGGMGMNSMSSLGSLGMPSSYGAGSTLQMGGMSNIGEAMLAQNPICQCIQMGDLKNCERLYFQSRGVSNVPSAQHQ